MKTVGIKLILFLIVVSSNLFSQELKYSDLENALEKPKGDFTSYVSKDGAVYKVGDGLTIGLPSSGNIFSFISGVNTLGQPFDVQARVSGQQTEIKQIFIMGTKKSGFYCVMKGRGNMGLENYTIRIENAIAAGEIKSFVMTSDEALSELKKAKDKLDLGLITQAEYDSLKVELSKYIK